MSEALIFVSTNNMTTDCSLNYKFSTRKFQAQNILCTQIVFCFDIQSKIFTQNVLSLEFLCTELAIKMNNLLSYHGLVDARIIASEKDLPVKKNPRLFILHFYIMRYLVFAKHQVVLFFLQIKLNFMVVDYVFLCLCYN